MVCCVQWVSKKGRTATTTMPRVFWCLAYLYLNTSNQVQPRNKLQNLSHAALLAKFHRAGNLQERHFLQAVGRRSVAYGHAVAAEESSPLLLCSNRGAIGSFLLPCQENSRLNIVLARHAAKILWISTMNWWPWVLPRVHSQWFIPTTAVAMLDH